MQPARQCFWPGMHSMLLTSYLACQVYDWPSGATYKGGVLNGKRHGSGIMHFAGTDVVYTGQWQNSKRHGQGKLVFDKAEKCFYKGSCQALEFAN